VCGRGSRWRGQARWSLYKCYHFVTGVSALDLRLRCRCHEQKHHHPFRCLLRPPIHSGWLHVASIDAASRS
jgi:hypothetical protein